MCVVCVLSDSYQQCVGYKFPRTSLHSRDGATVDILLSNCFIRQDEHTIFTGGGETEIQLSEISKPWGQQLLLFKTNTMLCVLTSGKVSA